METANLPFREDIFASVRYFISGNLEEKIEALLKNGGAQSRSYLSDIVTHLICGNSYTEEELIMGVDLYSVTPVTEKWIIHCAKLGRLASTKAFDPTVTHVMSGVRAAICNVSPSDRKKLYAVLKFHGAQVDAALNNNTTHLVCGLAVGNIYAKAITFPKSCILKVVTPDWVIDSIKRNQLIPCESYHPRLLKVEKPNLSKMVNTTTVLPSATPSNSVSTSTSDKAFSGVLVLDSSSEQNIPTLNIVKQSTQQLQQPSQAGKQQQHQAINTFPVINTTSLIASGSSTTTTSFTQVVRSTGSLLGENNIVVLPNNQLSSGNKTQLTGVSGGGSNTQTQSPIIFVRPRTMTQQNQPQQQAQQSPQVQPIILQQKIISQTVVSPTTSSENQIIKMHSNQVVTSPLSTQVQAQQQVGNIQMQQRKTHQQQQVHQMQISSETQMQQAKNLPLLSSQHHLQIQHQQQLQLQQHTQTQQNQQQKSPQQKLQQQQIQHQLHQQHQQQLQQKIQQMQLQQSQSHLAQRAAQSQLSHQQNNQNSLRTQTPNLPPAPRTPQPLQPSLQQPRTPQTPTGRQTPQARTPQPQQQSSQPSTPQPQMQQSPQHVPIPISPQPNQQQQQTHHQQLSQQQTQSITMSPQMLQQHILRQQQHLQQQQNILQQQMQSGQTLTLQQQNLVRQIPLQLQQLMQQQQTLQQQIQLQHQSPRMLQNQSPVIQQTTSPSLQQSGMIPIQPSPQASASPQSPQGHQQQLTVQQHRPQIQQGRQQRQMLVALGSPQQQVSQQITSQYGQQHQQQKIHLQNSPQHSGGQSPQVQHSISATTKQVLLSKPIDPTDPIQVAQVLSRSAPSPNHESLIMRQQMAQQLKAQQQQQQTPRQSPHQQIVISQGNQVIAQRHIINTSTTQGQQLIQSHMLNIQQQQQKQQILQMQQQHQEKSNTPTSPSGVSQNSIQLVQQNPTQVQNQVRMAQQTSAQPTVQQSQLQQSPGNFQHIITTQNHIPPSITQHQQLQQQIQQQQHQQQSEQLQQQITVASQTSTKQYPAKLIISQHQFNQLSLQQQQQILQNQQNHNVNPQRITQPQTLEHQSSQHQQQIQSPQIVSQSPSNIGQILKNYPQKQQQIVPPPMYSQAVQQQLDLEGNILQTRQPHQQAQQQPVPIQSQVVVSSSQPHCQQQSTQENTQQLHQIVINQPQIINQHRLHYLQQQQQIQLVQNKQQVPLITNQQSQTQPPQQMLIQQQQLQNASQGQTLAMQNQIIVQQHQQKQLQQFVQTDQQQQLILQQQNTQQIGQQDAIATQTQTVLIQQQPVMQKNSPQHQQQQIILQQQSPQQQQHQQHWNQQSAIAHPQSNTTATFQSLQPQVQQSQSPQFIRTVRPAQWQPGMPGPQRQLIQLDDKTHAHFMSLDPVKKAEYIAKLQGKQRLMLRQNVAYQPRSGAPNVVTNSIGVPRPTGTSHIILQSQMPTGLTQQQQIQWLQQQGARQVLVRAGTAPGLSPISQHQQQQQQQQQTSGTPQTFTVDSNQQILLQRHQLRVQQVQLPRDQSQVLQQQHAIQGVGDAGNILDQKTTQPLNVASKGTVVPNTISTLSPQSIAMAAESNAATSHVQAQQHQSSPSNQQNTQQQMNLKTKTALANMLSSRLSNNGSNPVTVASQQIVGPSSAPGTVVLESQNVIASSTSSAQTAAPTPVVEPSAAGTLRLMTAQHNAALGQNVLPNVLTQQELILLQQQQQQQQLRRPMQTQIISSSNAGKIVSSGVSQVSTPVVGGQFVQSRTPLPPRPQFYGHNPNLKLPPELFLLGCTFLIVEYEDSDADDIPIWIDTIKQYGGDIEKIYCPRITHVLCKTQRHGVVMQALRDAKRCITAYWLSDICFKKQMLPPWQCLHLPFPSIFGNQKPLGRYIITSYGFEGDELKRLEDMAKEVGSFYVSYLSKLTTVLICRKLEGEKYSMAKEWNIPVVNALWLSDIVIGNLSGMNQYENQKYQQYNLTAPFRIDSGLVPHLMAAWKAPINLTQEAHERVKRSHSDPYLESKCKRQKISPYQEELPESIVCLELPKTEKPPRVIFSQVIDVEALQRAVVQLGGLVVSSPSDATHLVMTRESRTCKLIQAVCHVNYVLKSTWLVESAKAGKFLPPEQFKIKYIQVEASLKFNLDTVVTSPLRPKLFNGKYFYVTPDVFPARSEIVQMIESSGGKVEVKRRSLQAISEALAQSPGSYIIITCPVDMHLLIDLARHGKPKCSILSTEFVMSSILKQELEYEPNIIPYLYNNNNCITSKKS